MHRTRLIRIVSGSLFAAGVVAAAPAFAQNHAEGKLVVGGKPVAITQVYAHSAPGFFDKKKLDVTVLMCDAPLPPAAVRDAFARRSLVDAGSVRCVEQVVDADRQVIHFEVQGKGYGHMQGGSTEHVFDAKTFDGRTIAGRARTKSPQTSFEDVPYSYDISFSAAIEAKP
jgi:hypothetical protein